MDADRKALYLRAKPVAMQALDLPDDEREAWLDEACGGDAALRAEAEWIVHAAEDTEGNGPWPTIVPVREGDDLHAVDSSNYRVLQRLGEGGAGVVYLAERTLDDARQKVALKLLNAVATPDTVHVRQRFAEERRILARLAHPNIAHLVDGGRTRDGYPFLAMEYVEGERIDAWCRRRALPLRARVKLFLKVCAAVQYAHRHLVIHRDIKPGNILVTAEGEPKLLDFGIARLLDGGTEAIARTATAQRALTVAYASPEQILGEPLSTATDVWSLGVLLYQLLCDERPFGGNDGTTSPLKVSNAIVAGQLVPPSRRAGDGKVPADLDAVALKALRREPSERYAGVTELAADLRRWLASRPVRALQGARWYRTRLFAHRHRVGLATATLVLVVLVAFMAARERQLHRVEVERDKARAVTAFMSELFENADPTHARGNHITVREVLDRGAAQLAKRPDIDPAAQATLLLSIGRAYNALDMGNKAIPVLKRATTLQHDTGTSVLERGRTMAALGRAYSMVLDLPSAVTADKQAIALLERAPGDQRDAIVRVRINMLYGQFDVQEISLEQIAARLEGILAGLDARPGADPELRVQALAALGMARAYLGDNAGARDAAQHALDRAERLYQPDNPALIYYRFVAALALMRTDPEAAVARYRQALADYDRMLGTPGPNLAAILEYFGQALLRAGRSHEALPALRRAADIASRFAADTPDFHLGVELTLAHGYASLGHGRQARAVLQRWQDALAERAAQHDGSALDHQARASNLLGRLDLRDGQLERAAHHFDAARNLLESRHGTARHASAYSASLAGLGATALARGDQTDATRFTALLETFRKRMSGTPDGDTVDLDARLLHAQHLAADDRAADARVLATAGAHDSLRAGGPCARHYAAFRQLLVSLPASAASTAPAWPACGQSNRDPGQA